MPQAAQRHGHKQRGEILHHEQAPRQDTGIGERVKHIVAQEQHQRHVPALPEILNIGGTERRIEVERQLNAEQQAEADRDVRIAGEVIQNLETEAERQPGFPVRHQTELGLGIDRIEQASDPVAEYDLLEQAHRDEADTEAELALPAGRIYRAAELMHDLGPPRQRPGDRLREKRDVERVAGKRKGWRLAAPQIDQIHDVMEGEE